MGRGAWTSRAVLATLLLTGSGGHVLAQNNIDTIPGNGSGVFTSLVRGWLARQQAGALWRRFSPRRRGLLTQGSPWLDGAAAGRVSPVAAEAEGPQGWGLWLDGAPMFMRNLATATEGRGYTLSHTLGLDRQLTEHTSVGLNVGYSYGDAKTIYNNGRERTHGLTIGPYLSHQIASWLSLDAQGGYVWQRQKLRRQDAAGVHTGRRTSHGYQFSAALNAWKWVNGNAMISGRLGLIATHDRWKAYTEQSPGFTSPVPGVAQTLVQGVVEGGVSWWVDPLMPYVKAAYAHDLYRRNIQGASDRDDFTLTGGMMWYGSGELDGLSLDAGANVIVGRRLQRQWGLSLGLKWSW